ncbi:hypothetical protein KEM52_002391 [Ascosphaera acerosa]|nr:hypothetical protein KEM52_002391 [Ascosphaera acerosa]
MSAVTSSRLPHAPLHTLYTHSGPVNAVCFSQNAGTYVLTGSSDRAIHLSRAVPTTGGRASSHASPATSTPIQRYNEHAYGVLDLAVSADNARFASVGGDKKVFLWDVERATTLRRWLGHEGRVEAVAFGGVDDSVVVSGSADSTVKLWDARAHSAKPIQTLAEARDTVSAVDVHMPSATVVSGSYDGRVRSYDLRAGRTTTDVVCVGGGGAVTSVACSQDGQAVLASCLDSKVRMLDRSNGAVLRGFGGSSSPATITGAVAAVPVTYHNESLRIRSCWAVGDGVVISGGEGERSGGEGGAEEGRLFAWDVLSGDMIAAIGMGRGVKVVSSVAWSESARTWAAGCSDGSVRVFGPGDGRG